MCDGVRGWEKGDGREGREGRESEIWGKRKR